MMIKEIWFLTLGRLGCSRKGKKRYRVIDLKSRIFGVQK